MGVSHRSESLVTEVSITAAPSEKSVSNTLALSDVPFPKRFEHEYRVGQPP
jgi:hypothetical protein